MMCLLPRTVSKENEHTGHSLTVPDLRWS